MNIVEALNDYYSLKEQNIDSDGYQAALDIDLAILSLLQDEKITKAESQAFYYLLGGYSFRKIASMLNLDRKIMSVRLREIVKMVEELYYA